MWFFSKKVKVAVLTPFTDHYCSPLYPKVSHPPSKKWLYYDMCLDKHVKVKYFPLEEAKKISGFDYVLIHENLYDCSPEQLMETLKGLKARNQKLYWFELHGKSLYSEGIFLPGFFDLIDRVYKHQKMDPEILKEELKKPLPNLAPFQLFGACDLLTYLRKWSGFSYSESIFENHLQFPFENVKEKIFPLMYPFSFHMIEGGFPSYSFGSSKQYHVAMNGKPTAINHVHRNFLGALLAKTGISFHYEAGNDLGALKSSRYFLALGPIHSSMRTFDTLAFDTVLVHYKESPYELWPEFKEYETFLPFGNVQEMFPAGGLGHNPEAIASVIEQFQKDCQNEKLRRELLEKQKSLFYQLIDSKFILQKIGIEL